MAGRDGATRRRPFFARPAVRDGLTAALFLAPNLLGFLLFTLVPVVAAIVLSLYHWPLLGTPSFAGWDNYVRAFTRDPIFGTVLLNTAYFTVVFVPIDIVVALGLAVWLASGVRGAQVFRILFFIPALTPVVANALVWALLYVYPDGFIDWFLQATFHMQGPDWIGSDRLAMLSVIAMSVWQGFGYNMVIFSAGLQQIPESLYAAAAVDGAGAWVRFRYVTLPMLSPSLFFALVLTLISAFQVFGQPFVLTNGGPGVSTTTLVFYLYQNGFTYGNLGYVAALSVVLFAIIVAVTLAQFLAQRVWVYYDA